MIFWEKITVSCGEKGLLLGKKTQTLTATKFSVWLKFEKVYSNCLCLSLEYHDTASFCKNCLIFHFHGEDWSCQTDPASLFLGQVKLLHKEVHLFEQDSDSVHHCGIWPSAMFVLCHNWYLQAAHWTHVWDMYFFWMPGKGTWQQRDYLEDRNASFVMKSVYSFPSERFFFSLLSICRYLI